MRAFSKIIWALISTIICIFFKADDVFAATQCTKISSPSGTLQDVSLYSGCATSEYIYFNCSVTGVTFRVVNCLTCPSGKTLNQSANGNFTYADSQYIASYTNCIDKPNACTEGAVQSCVYGTGIIGKKTCTDAEWGDCETTSPLTCDTDNGYELSGGKCVAQKNEGVQHSCGAHWTGSVSCDYQCTDDTWTASGSGSSITCTKQSYTATTQTCTKDGCTITCAAGYYPLSGGMCDTCPAGQYCTGGDAAPIDCPTGSYATGGASQCTLCAGGKKNTGTKNTSCTTDCTNTGAAYVTAWETPYWGAATGNIKNLCTISTCKSCSTPTYGSCSGGLSNNTCTYTTSCDNDCFTLASSGTPTPTCTPKTYTYRFGDSYGNTNTLEITYDPTEKQGISIGGAVESRPGYTVTEWCNGTNTCNLNYGTTCYTFGKSIGNATCEQYNDLKLPASQRYCAVYEPNKYTVTIDANGGKFDDNTTTKSHTQTYDQTMSTSAYDDYMLSRSYYKFKGIFDAKTGGTQYYEPTDDGWGLNSYNGKKWDKTTNTTLYAQWIPKTYTIEYDIGDGYWSTDGQAKCATTHTYDQETKILCTPLSGNSAKSFYRWCYTANPTDINTNCLDPNAPVIDAKKVGNTNDVITLYAHYTQVYRIKYDPNGGLWPDGTVSDDLTGKEDIGGTSALLVEKYTRRTAQLGIGQGIFTINSDTSRAPTRTNHVLSSWCGALPGESEQCYINTTIQFNPATDTLGNMTFTAGWTKCACTSSLDTGAYCSVTGVTDNKCVYDSGCNQGYSVTSGEDTSNPQCEAKTYKITLYATNDDHDSSYFDKHDTTTGERGNMRYWSIKYDTKPTTLTAEYLPVDDKYNFAGFYDTSASSGGTQYYNASGVPQGDFASNLYQPTSQVPLKLYARWTPKTSTVTIYYYKNNVIKEWKTITVTQGQRLPPIDAYPASFTMLGTHQPVKGIFTTRSGGTQYYWYDSSTDGMLTYVTAPTWDLDNNPELYIQWDSSCDACTTNTKTSCSLSIKDNACTYTTSCVEGYHNLQGGGTKSPTCDDCPAGSYCTGGTAKQCDPGTYNGTTGKVTACSNCTGRTKYSAKGATKCETVDSGHYTTGCTGTDKCTGQSECKTRAKYCTGGVETDVTDGYYTTGCNTSNNQCTGEKICDKNNYCVDGVKKACTTLATIYAYTESTGADDATKCYASLAGQYIATEKAATATDCAAGTYVSSGTKVFYGSTSSCTDASAGNYTTGCNTSDKKCTGENKCAIGSHSAAKASACTACPNGKTTSGTGTATKSDGSQCSTCSNDDFVADNGWKTQSWSANTVANLCKIETCKPGYDNNNSTSCDAHRYIVTYKCGYENCNMVDVIHGTDTDPLGPLYNAKYTTLGDTQYNRTGYNYDRWAVSDTSVTWDAGTTKTWTYTNDKTLTPYWVPNEYTITWIANCPSKTIDNITEDIDYGAKFDNRNPFACPGHTFAGWTNGSTYTTAENNLTYQTAGDATMTATWTANTYTVKLYGNNGSPDMTLESTRVPPVTSMQSMPTLNKLPARAGYAFAGYYDKASGGNKYYNANGSSAKNWDIYEPNNNTEYALYAHWTKCGEHTYSTAEMSACGTPNEGFFADGCADDGTTCTKSSQCPAGSYCTGGEKISCTTIDDTDNLYKNSDAQSPLPEHCYANVPAGYHIAKSKDKSATICGRGTFLAGHKVYYGDTSTCQNPKDGYYATSCDAATNATDDNGCATETPCPANYYCMGGIDYACNAIENTNGIYNQSAGTTTTTTANDPTDCYTTVPAGQYVERNADKHSDCLAGTYMTNQQNVNYGASSACDQAQAGYYTIGCTGANNTKCTNQSACATGSWATAGSSACTACPNGTTTSGIAGSPSYCSNCDNNTANNNIAEWLDQEWKSADNTVSNLCRIKSCDPGYDMGTSSIGLDICTAHQYALTYTCGYTDCNQKDITVKDGPVYNDQYTLLGRLTYSRTGYTFAGWGVSGTNDVLPAGASGDTLWTYTENKTLTAQWTNQSYSVSYDCNNDENTSGTPAGVNNTATYDTEYTTATQGTCARIGYDFAGWEADDKKFTADEKFKWTYTKNMRFSAIWTPNKYTVKYTCGTDAGTNGTAPESNTATYDTDYTMATKGTCARTGYTFQKWTSTNGGTHSAGEKFKWTYTNEVEYKPTWGANQYTITWTTNCPTADATSTSVKKYFNETFDNRIDGKFTCPGHEFAGWTYDTSVEIDTDKYKESANDVQFTTASDITLTATWQAKKYTVTLKGNGGTPNKSLDNVITLQDMPTINKDELPTRDGYTFNGYYDKASGGNQYYNKNGSSTKKWDIYTPNDGNDGYALWAQWDTCPKGHYCESGNANEPTPCPRGTTTNTDAPSSIKNCMMTTSTEFCDGDGCFKAPTEIPYYTPAQ